MWTPVASHYTGAASWQRHLGVGLLVGLKIQQQPTGMSVPNPMAIWGSSTSQQAQVPLTSWAPFMKRRYVIVPQAAESADMSHLLAAGTQWGAWGSSCSLHSHMLPLPAFCLLHERTRRRCARKGSGIGNVDGGPCAGGKRGITQL